MGNKNVKEQNSNKIQSLSEMPNDILDFNLHLAFACLP